MYRHHTLFSPPEAKAQNCYVKPIPTKLNVPKKVLKNFVRPEFYWGELFFGTFFLRNFYFVETKFGEKIILVEIFFS